MGKQTRNRQRRKLNIIHLMDMFPNEKAAEEWFEKTLWPEERCCGHCGSTNTYTVPNRKLMPYRCRDCERYFSVRTGTPIAKTNLSLHKWAMAIYLELTSLKSIASTKLASDIGVSQPAAWFMLHRIREAWTRTKNGGTSFSGPVEVDETYIGGKRRNMNKTKRAQMSGRGPTGKMAVAGIKDRSSNQVSAQVVRNTKSETMSLFIMEHVKLGTKIYTDDALTYHTLPNHETVKHSIGEYVRGKAYTNGVESFWSMLKRAHTGVFHKISPKHLDRYVREFAGKHNLRQLDTLHQMRRVVRGLAGKQLMYQELIADNGLSSGARAEELSPSLPGLRFHSQVVFSYL